MRRVLVVHPSPDLYGSDRQLLETIDGLVAAGWEVRVALPSDGPLRPLLVAHGARVAIIDFPVLRKSLLSARGLAALAGQVPAAVLRLRRAVRTAGADVVMANTVTVPLAILGARLRGTPVLCHLHEAETDQPRLLRAMLAAPLLLTRTIIANSQAARDAIVEALPLLADRVSVVHNGVPDSPTMRRPLRARTVDDSVQLALVGRLSPRKGIDVALEAVAMLRRAGRAVTIDVCGTAFAGYEWYEDELRERASRGDLHGAVTFHGYVHPTDAVLDAADIVLVPSRAEPFGNSAVEGLLRERPVIASRVQGLAEVIDDRRTGLLVAPGSATDLARAVAELADDPARALKLARAGRADALDRFSIERYRAAIVDHVTAVRG